MISVRNHAKGPACWKGAVSRKASPGKSSGARAPRSSFTIVGGHPLDWPTRIGVERVKLRSAKLSRAWEGFAPEREACLWRLPGRRARCRCRSHQCRHSRRRTGPSPCKGLSVVAAIGFEADTVAQRAVSGQVRPAMPAARQHVSLVVGTASFFLFAVLLYVRPHLRAALLQPRRTVYDPYQHAYWLCLLSFYPPHVSARCQNPLCAQGQVRRERLLLCLPVRDRRRPHPRPRQLRRHEHRD